MTLQPRLHLPHPTTPPHVRPTRGEGAVCPDATQVPGAVGGAVGSESEQNDFSTSRPEAMLVSATLSEEVEQLKAKIGAYWNHI